MSKLYYNYISLNGGGFECTDICKYTKVDSKVPRVGSVLCAECKYQLDRSKFENWILCKAHLLYLREEKLNRILNGNN